MFSEKMNAELSLPAPLKKLKLPEPLLLGLVSLCVLWCLALWMARAWQTQSGQYFYFVYNLALAGIPLVISLIVYRFENRRVFCSVGLLWLLFFPNAPYLLTDLIHLRPRHDAPFWFDWILMISFAGAGFLIGCFSLYLIHRRLILWMGKTKAWMMVIAIWCLSAFGIYLGRFPRWNSWDIATNPLSFFTDVFTRLTNPHEHPVMVMYTPGLAFVLIIGYIAVAGGWLQRPAQPSKTNVPSDVGT